MNNKNTILAIFIALIIIALGYILFWKSVINTNQENIANTGSNVNNSSGNTIDQGTGSVINETSDWKVFNNNEYWFSLKYPDNFFDIWHEPNTLVWDCDYKDFQEVCPNINNIATDLNNYNNWENKWEKVNINNTDYCLYNIQDAATWHVYNSYYYTTVKNNKCFVIALNTSSTNCDFYLPLENWNIEQKSNYDNCVTKNKNQPVILKKIISTFKFE